MIGPPTSSVSVEEYDPDPWEINKRKLGSVCLQVETSGYGNKLIKNWPQLLQAQILLVKALSTNHIR
jgi:hypothetical protein